jgi:hypothetical protein
MSFARLARFPEMKKIIHDLYFAANESNPDMLFWADVQDKMHEMTDAELTVVEDEILSWTDRQRHEYAIGRDSLGNESGRLATEKTNAILMVLAGFN